MLIFDLTTPRPGPVDPERCPMCRRLRDTLSAAITSGNAPNSRAVVYAMYAHTTQGHPTDPRNVR
jgi:hypothetical protein